MTAPGGIEARGLTKRYGPVTVLDGIDFRLAEGSKTALLGANGAGKTTLLTLLSTLVAPSAGEASVAGHEVTSAATKLRRSIGVMTHQPMLYEELSPLENLQFFAKLYDVVDAEQRIETLLRRIGLWLRRDEPTGVLSRGFHQRLALARAIVHAPPVLLVDEPETGLDEAGIELLDELVLRAPGVTVLAATHRHDHLDAWAEGTLVLERGRLLGVPAAEMAEALR